MTSTTHTSRHPRWEAFTKSFKYSNYITDFWNWFMTLMSKAAEMVLFGIVLYSGYQLLPAVPHVPDGIDAAIFVIHALREEYGDSAVTVKEANELQECIEALSRELGQVQQDMQQRLEQQARPLCHATGNGTCYPPRGATDGTRQSHP